MIIISFFFLVFLPLFFFFFLFLFSFFFFRSLFLFFFFPSTSCSSSWSCCPSFILVFCFVFLVLFCFVCFCGVRVFLFVLFLLRPLIPLFFFFFSFFFLLSFFYTWRFLFCRRGRIHSLDAKIKFCSHFIAQKDIKINMKLKIEICHSFLFPRLLFDSNLQLSCRSKTTYTSYFIWLKRYSSLLQMSMNAPLRLPFVTWMRNATILLAHTAVLATLGTLVTGKHALVRKLGRAM